MFHISGYDTRKLIGNWGNIGVSQTDTGVAV